MNWTEIKVKYRSAFLIFHLWNQESTHAVDRDLYDFFDEQGIYITISARPLHDELPIEYWLYVIVGKDIREISSNRDTRFEAEEAAFNKSFEILEEK